MDPISLFKKTKFSNTIWWQLQTKVQGFQNELGYDLVTEIFKNRKFRLVEKDLFLKNWKFKSRILVQLFEDGYLCWINIDNLVCQKWLGLDNPETTDIYDEFYIQSKIPYILDWINDQAKVSNKYLWGGTCGPDFDCSGLIQSAYLSQNIFLPRDSYQMRNFCKNILYSLDEINSLKMGDILFFGSRTKCNHVGIYIQNGYYYHSSGKDTGRDGIGIDRIIKPDNSISCYYLSKFIAAGRVIRSYKWNKTLR